MNALHYGDNLDVLRGFPPESVDLVYLDPPFNSNANYNVLFKSPQGKESQAQIEAFEDTWHWGEQAEREYHDLLAQDNTDVAEMMRALLNFLGKNDMMAYLVMMANRLLRLHNVLKPTGSLYLHCDPTASHYLKVVLDGVFGQENFRNEIIWQRTGAHNDSRRYGRVSDTILFFSKSDSFTFNTQYIEYSPEYIAERYKYNDGDGRLYWRNTMTAAGAGPAKKFRGVEKVPPAGTHWRFSQREIDRLEGENRIYYSPTGMPYIKSYLDEQKGRAVQNIWTDIVMSKSGAERLGYPTQKPLALLERIINASSNPGDVVLDPFCGCGTALHAAQKLGRHWIGIDITHLAISLIESRLRSAFKGIEFETHGTPRDLGGAEDLFRRDAYQFQWWACSLVGAQPYKGKKKGADGGIDGLLFIQDELSGEAKRVIVSVKGGANISVTMIREFAHVVDSTNSVIGLFVTLTPPKGTMLKEAASAGFYQCPHNKKNYPKIQILTIDGLLSGRERPEYLDLSQGGATFKQAPREKGPKQKQFKLG